MTPARGSTGLSGILPVDKPAGMTSHDVVARIRSATGERRIGHAGTLDPAATGLLIVLIGQATRLARYASGADKSYLADITFGVETDTLDAEGSVTSTVTVPDSVLDPAAARLALGSFLGASIQIPPAYSAIKTAGTAAHRLARSGEDVQLDGRPVVVHDATLVDVDPAAPRWTVAFTVSKGTYIRSLARDIGRAMGTVAHLSALRRTAAGSVGLDHAYTLDDIVRVAATGAIHTLFLDPVVVLGLPTLPVDAADVADGRSLPVPGGLAPGAERVACVTPGLLLAVYVRQGETLKAETVLPGGVSR